MRCNDAERTFVCQTASCIANRSEIDLVEFYSHVRSTIFSQAVTELKAIDILGEPPRHETKTSKGFASAAELLDFHRKSQPEYEFRSEHVWHNSEHRAQRIVWRFERKAGSGAVAAGLILHGNFYRGKWYRTRLQTAKAPMPYNWHLNQASSFLLICRDELEADCAQKMGQPSVALSSLGVWESAYAGLFSSLDVAILSDPGAGALEYRKEASRDLSAVVRSLRLVELSHLEPETDSQLLRDALASAKDVLNPWEQPELPLTAFEAIPGFDPEEMLPESIRYHLVNLSDDLQCPVDMLAAPAIAGLSVLIGRKLTVQPKPQSPDFKVAIPLWCVLIADPGQKKTQILKSALAPIFAIEDAFAPDNTTRAAQKAFDTKALMIKERDLDARLSEAVKAGNQTVQHHLRESLISVEEEKSALAARGPRQYIIRDATPEKMLEVLAQNPNGCMQFADEVPGWWRSLSTSHLDMRKLFLEGWGGLRIHVQRKSYSLRGDSILSVVGGAQPAWIESLVEGMRKGGQENDGLINRFSLLINHEPLLGKWEYVDRKQSPQAKEWYETIFGAFHELATDDILKDRQTGDSNSIRFSPEAQEVFVSWITTKENAIREGLYPRLLASHVSKYTTLFASLSLIFHLIFFFEGKEDGSEEISAHAANLAKKWCDYLFYHARRTLSETKPYPLAVRALAALISSGELKDGSSLSTLHGRQHLHLRDLKETREALEFLAGKKLVRLVGDGNAELIRINPHASTAQRFPLVSS